MRKLIALLLCLLLTLPALAEALPLTEEDFTLRLTDAEDAAVYAVGDDAGALLAALADCTGAPVIMTFEDADSSLPGMTREYATADGLFALTTRPQPEDPQGSMVEAVTVLAAEAVTRRGARVGMSLEEIAAIYGPDYALEWNTVIYGHFDGPQIYFFFDTETWTCIGWMLMRNTLV